MSIALLMKLKVMPTSHTGTLQNVSLSEMCPKGVTSHSYALANNLCRTTHYAWWFNATKAFMLQMGSVVKRRWIPLITCYDFHHKPAHTILNTKYLPWSCNNKKVTMRVHYYHPLIYYDFSAISSHIYFTAWSVQGLTTLKTTFVLGERVNTISPHTQ